MGRYVQLEELVRQLKAETGQSVLTSAGLDDRDALKALLSGTQEELYDDYDWLHMRITAYKAFDAGQRYCDIPEDMDIESLESVSGWYNNKEYGLRNEISFADYSIFNSDADARSDPIQKWDVRWTGTVEQIEVWPIPSTNTQQLKFVGKRKLRPLVSESDVCDLDSRSIVLAAATGILFGQDSARAKHTQGRAEKSIAMAKARQVKPGAAPILRGGRSRQGLPTGRAVVMVS